MLFRSAATLARAGLRFAAHATGTPPADPARFRREYFVKAGGAVRGGPGPREADAPEGARAADVQRLNDRLLALACRSPGPAWLASPATGGGVEVGFAAMLMLEAWRRGVGDVPALAREAEAALGRLGQRLVRDGEVLVDPAQSRARLEQEARDLLTTTLPSLRRAGVIA